MDIVAVIAARENAVGLDDIMDMLAEGPPVRAESEIDRFWEWVDDDRRPSTEDMNLRVDAPPPRDVLGRARRSPNIVMLHYDDLTRRPRGRDAPARGAARHRGARGSVARAGRGRDVRRHAEQRRRDRAETDERDLARQRAVLQQGHERPVASTCSTMPTSSATRARRARSSRRTRPRGVGAPRAAVATPTR